jgi:hypothetical protein
MTSANGVTEIILIDMGPRILLMEIDSDITLILMDGIFKYIYLLKILSSTQKNYIRFHKIKCFCLRNVEDNKSVISSRKSRGRAYITMAKGKRTKGQTMIYKTLHRTLKI